MKRFDDDLDVKALTLLTKALLPGFIERNAGTIINTGSVAACSQAWRQVLGSSQADSQRGRDCGRLGVGPRVRLFSLLLPKIHDEK